MKVDVSMPVLQWITSSVDPETLSDQNRQLLEAWCTGEKQPTFKQLEAVSGSIGIPFGYFFLPEPLKEDVSLFEYRTIDSTEQDGLSRTALNVMQDMERVQAWMHDERIREQLSPLAYVGAAQSVQSGEALSEVMRTVLQLPMDWQRQCRHTEEAFRTLRQRISEAGTLVMLNGVMGANTHRSLNIHEFRAFALVDRYAPLIFINTQDALSAQLFSLAHEFAHICMGAPSWFNDRKGTHTTVNRTEQVCNAAAGELLLPETLFLTAWSAQAVDHDVDQQIQTVADRFHVSRVVVARKAKDRGLIDQTTYVRIADEAVQAYQAMKAKRKAEGASGGHYYNTLSHRLDPRFLRALISSVQMGQTAYTEAYQLTHTHRKTFDALVERVGG